MLEWELTLSSGAAENLCSCNLHMCPPIKFGQTNDYALLQEVGEVRGVTSGISLPTLLSAWVILWSVAWQEALVAHLGAKLLTPCGTSFELVSEMSYLTRKLSCESKVKRRMVCVSQPLWSLTAACSAAAYEHMRPTCVSCWTIYAPCLQGAACKQLSWVD